jgi:uncharacterized protein (TIGR01777 family)
MRILLTGGTGFIGTALVRALVERRDDVVIVSRGPKGSVKWGEIDAEVSRADAVIHLAGEPMANGRWTAQRLERIRSSRIDTTSRIAGAIERATRKPLLFVSASGVGIYGMRLDEAVLDERTPPADDELGRICVAWEAAADPARAAGVRVVHPRFGMVLGRGGALAKLELPFKFFVGGPLGGGRQWISWVHQRDVVRSLLFAVEKETLHGPINVCAPEPVTMNDFARALGHALGRPAALRAPTVALRLALGDGLAKLLLTGQRVVPGVLRQAGFVFEFPRLPGALANLYGEHGVSR